MFHQIYAGQTVFGCGKKNMLVEYSLLQTFSSYVVRVVQAIWSIALYVHNSNNLLPHLPVNSSAVIVH